MRNTLALIVFLTAIARSSVALAWLDCTDVGHSYSADGRFAALEKCVQELGSENSSRNATISNLSVDNLQLREQVETLRSKVDDLQNRVMLLEVRLTGKIRKPPPKPGPFDDLIPKK